MSEGVTFGAWKERVAQKCQVLRFEKEYDRPLHLAWLMMMMMRRKV